MQLTRQLVFVQGGGKGTHDEWDNQLVDSLRRELGEKYEILYPRMPREEDPQYAPWRKALEAVLEKLRPPAILVAHSVGATVLLKALSEGTPAPKLDGIFLIAPPFVGEGGWSVDDLQFPRALGASLPRGVPIHFFHGLNDQDVPPSHLDLYARAVPEAHVHRLPGRDHQLNSNLKEVAAAISTLETQR
jgi:predicted alpha/beta hydrolase family esterase